MSRRSSATRAPVRLRCDAGRFPAQAGVVDSLARVALVARRHGCELWLVAPSPELRELIAFMGLQDALPREA